MAKAKKQKPEKRDIVSILNNPADKAKLQAFIDEAVRCKIRAADEQESLKGIRDEALDKIGCNPKDFNSLVKMFYNNNFSEVQDEIHRLDAMIEMLTGQSGKDSE